MKINSHQWMNRQLVLLLCFLLINGCSPLIETRVVIEEEGVDQPTTPTVLACHPANTSTTGHDELSSATTNSDRPTLPQMNRDERRDLNYVAEILIEHIEDLNEYISELEQSEQDQ